MIKLNQCVITSNDENKDATNVIRAIKKAGFDGVFLQWYNNNDLLLKQEEQFELCKKLGLNVEFVHLGYKGINNLWVEGVEGDLLVDGYLKDLEVCSAYAVKLVVMHLTSKYTAPEPNMVGVARIKKIADYAEKLGIKIALENTKIFGYLEYVFDYIKNDNLGVCFDIGHCHCHFEDRFSWDKFKGKIWALHLHDNHGKIEDEKERDEHLLPFDGTINWDYFVEKLIKTGYNGSITLESHNKHYKNLSLDEFYKLSYEKASLLKDKFQSGGLL